MGERIARRVDGDVVLLLQRERSTGGADVERIVDHQVVLVHGRARVALDVALVLRSEQPRIDRRIRGRLDDGDAHVHERPVDARHVQLLRARFVHRRSDVVRRRPERLARAAVDGEAVGAVDRVAECERLQLLRVHLGECRPRDVERVRDAPAHVAAAEHDEPVVPAWARALAGARDGDELALAARRDGDERREVQ